MSRFCYPYQNYSIVKTILDEDISKDNTVFDIEKIKQFLRNLKPRKHTVDTKDIELPYVDSHQVSIESKNMYN
jgi:hypothetical protein